MGTVRWTRQDYERRRRVLTRILDQLVSISGALGRLQGPDKPMVTRVELFRLARKRQPAVFRGFAAKAKRDSVRRYWRLVHRILDELERQAQH